jgi:hypothetical protein
MNLMILKYLKRKHHNIIIKDDSNETKEKKVIKKLELRKTLIMKFDKLY